MTNVIEFPGNNDESEPEDSGETPVLEGEVISPEPEKVKGSTKDGKRKQIVPEPLKRANIKATAKYHGGLNWHRFRYHGFRVPRYVPLGIFWAGIGVLRIAGAQLAWAFDAATEFLARESVAKSDAREYMSLSHLAENRRRVRLGVLAAEALGVLIVCLYLALSAPWLVGVLVLLGVLPVLAHVGRPDNKPIVTSAVVPPTYEAPTPIIIERALGSLGIPNINAALKDGGHITWVTDVHRDGAGWGVQLDLPFGVTAENILAKRDHLASGLRRPLSAVWPSGVPSEHPGRCDLWIGFQDLAKVAPPKYPLLKSGTADVFADIPFGVDPRSRPVPAGLFELNWLIGAAPGQGKTATLRVLAASAALDVVADIWTHEFSGKGDLEALARISHRYVGGLDDESLAYGAESLAMLRKELERRSKVFKDIPREHRPDGKLTRDLAVKRSNKLRPIVAIFDEVQNLFTDPKHGKKAAEDAAYIIRLGRAYGIILVLATQRPDATTLPTAISGNVTARFCLHVPGQVETDLILGTSSYQNGYRPSLFRPKTDAGMGWLKSEGTPQIVRTYYIDLPEFEKVCQRARVLREGAGVLSGYALGEADDQGERNVLQDVLACFGPGEPGLHWETLSARLSDRFPSRWSEVTPASVSADVRRLDVPSVTVTVDGDRARGCRRADLEKAGETS